MIGHIVYSYLKTFSDLEVLGLSGSKKFDNRTKILDVTNINSFNDYVKTIKPNVIINCIGLLIEESEKNIKDAVFLNAYFPHHLKILIKKNNFKLVHISTDYVFWK